MTLLSKSRAVLTGLALTLCLGFHSSPARADSASGCWTEPPDAVYTNYWDCLGLAADLLNECRSCCYDTYEYACHVLHNQQACQALFDCKVGCEVGYAAFRQKCEAIPHP